MWSRFQTDQRAIDGTALRVVIALALATAATTVLAGPLADVRSERVGDTEVTVRLEESVVTLEGESVLTVRVVTEDGRRVTDTSLLIRSGSLPLVGGPVVRETGPESNEVELRLSTAQTADLQVAFRPRQSRGTLVIDVVSLVDGTYVDERANPELAVVDG